MKVIITDGIHPKGAELLRNAGLEVTEKKLSPDELLDQIKNYDAIIVRSATKVPKEVIDAGSLKCIARGGVGLDNIDTVYAKEKGIQVLNTPGASSISVAELAIGHMIGVSRFLHLSNTAMREGKWPKKEYKAGRELTGKTLGLMGLGAIGRETAKRAIGLMMNVIAYDPFVKETALDVKLVTKDELLAQSDYISMHMPFIKAEGAAMGEEEFKKVKKGLVLVNCARGGVVNEKALLAALNDGTVDYAGIDVFENEPPTDAQKELINHPNVSVTPHIGASTGEAQERVGVEIAEKVINCLKG
ncbi:MAG: D-2-hydroxyacid dehydrogenase [Candidatus Kapaibacterium sp.]